MNPILKTKVIRLKGQKLAKLNETIHQRDQHKCIYCGNRVDPGEKFHHEHNGIKSDQIEYGVLLCMDCHTERHHGKKCNMANQFTVNKKAEVLTSAFFAFSMQFDKSW